MQNRLIQNPAQSVQGVQEVKPQSDANALVLPSLRDLNWNDLSIFLDVAEAGSMRAAAAKRRVAVNTVRARVEKLEELVGTRLLIRQARGVRLTANGQRIRHMALGMQGAAAHDSNHQVDGLRRAGELRITTSEALGSGWLIPRLFDLQAQFPSITMTMLCDNDLEVDHSADVDLGVAWKMPRNPDLIISKLATIHMLPFTSREYLQVHGTPRLPEDLLHHSFIEQVSPGIKSDLLDNLVGTDRPPGFLRLRTNSSLAIFWAVANGNGIAFMPTFAPAVIDKLVAIDLPFRIKHDLFYYYHPDAKSCPIVNTAIDWLKASFDPNLYPWFKSEFIHPNEFLPRRQGNVVPLFQNLAPPEQA